jgi:hypothetical protein
LANAAISASAIATSCGSSSLASPDSSADGPPAPRSYSGSAFPALPRGSSKWRARRHPARATT